MIIRKFLSVPIMTILLLFSAQLWAETDCSKEAIAYYLEKGFTPEQVTRMCQVSAHSDETDTTDTTDTKATATKATATKATATKDDGQIADASGNERQGSLKNDDFVFFSRTILSDSLTVTPETLTYVGEECISYDEEDMTGFRPKVCGVLKTTINRTGLVVLRAAKGLFIFRDAQLLVKGEIQRKVINLDSLDSDDRKTFARILDPTPETLEIKTREGADLKEVAARLPR